MAKAKSVEPEVVENEVGIIEGKLSTSNELNALTVIPNLTYDAVIWDNKNLSLDSAASRAYMALKAGGIFIVEKCEELEMMLPVLMSMFDIQETKKGIYAGDDGIKKEVVVFVKEK